VENHRELNVIEVATVASVVFAVGIRQTPNGWQAYIKVRGEFRSRRFPADTPREEMEAWLDDQRTSGRDKQRLSAASVWREFWTKYDPSWHIKALSKTPSGWKLQLSVAGTLRQRRYSPTTPLHEILKQRASWEQEQQAAFAASGRPTFGRRRSRTGTDQPPSST
jgi:hypothetical protein